METPRDADPRPPPAQKTEALTLFSRLADIARRTPVTVPLQTPVREALELMERQRIGSIVVVDGAAQRPLGIFTLKDLLQRVTLADNDLEQPIAAVMTSGLHTVTPQATAYQAALAMARHGVRHMPVVDAQGRLTGMVSQNDLFSLQRLGVKDLGNDIRQARDLPALQRAADEIRRLAYGMAAQGMHAETLTHSISTLNDLLTARIIEHTIDALEVPVVRMCWIALGSEGRLEQTLSTDQDNGIIFDAASAQDAQRVRQLLLPFAQAVNRALDACGFPLCKGNIMAGNPQWCLSLDEWKQTFSGWINQPQPKALLNAAIFFDFRPLYGDEQLAEQLRAWLLAGTAGNPLFLRCMTGNALQSRPALGLIRDFSYDDAQQHPHTIDLKMRGARPFIDAARILALGHGIGDTNTAERLRAVSAQMAFGDDVAALVEGFYFIQSLRLRPPPHPAGANRIDPAQMNELNRRILKEAFKQARKLQRRMKMDYGL